MNVPTFSEEETDNGKTVTISYPEGEGLIYEYQKDSGEWQIATQNQEVKFTENGTLVARVSDGTNTVNTSTYTVEVGSLGSDLVESAGIVTSGDGLYEDLYEDNVYTYRGSNPNNYVTFNGEQWRIVSINTTDNSVKIMRNEILEGRQFDTASGRYQGSNGYCNNSSYGCNIWGSNSTLYDNNLNPITEVSREANGTKYTLPEKEADLNTYLNDTYYNNLNEVAKEMIKSDAIYKVGIVDYSDSSTLANNIEQVNSVKWKGKVALIDVTEYMRASTNSRCIGMGTATNLNYNRYCYIFNWLHDTSDDYVWTISPYANNSSAVWCIVGNGYYLDSNYSRTAVEFRPVVTLSGEVKITGGDGSSTNSYQLSL